MKSTDFKKDNCFFCSNSERLVVHHIDTDRQNNVAVNLLTLCDSCHRKLHTIYHRMLSSGVFVRKKKGHVTPLTKVKASMDIVDISKIREQYDAGFSIHRLSIFWNLPYASLYRALKKVDGEGKESKSK